MCVKMLLSNAYYSIFNCVMGCRMFQPIMGSAHWPNQPFSQPLNREVFLVTWAESTMYVTGADGLHGLKRLLYSNWKVGSVDLITSFIFNWEMLYDKLLAFSNL